MYQNPTLFPAISNRESWLQIIQLADGDTGQPIALTDTNNNPLYSINLEITSPQPRGHLGGFAPSPWYDGGCAPSISGSLSNYISIVDVGVIQILIPKSVMQQLSPKTYDVYLTLNPNGEDDGRQLLIGRLPVAYGGRAT